ncbi:adenylyltransferase and sulfurtransferase MOCS3-2 isoform X1 [Canna indica]|uniref:Adenylyltransferase and sulfurtransferase MOCS3 n=1 Tax=Canna indica TaxID=4628 RepID=A0AAQ3KQR2_9LILI|nr:adenylyltransferase and sulfurtransferase MOCS3-2 isoform X1 [Canna indica]
MRGLRSPPTLVFRFQTPVSTTVARTTSNYLGETEMGSKGVWSGSSDAHLLGEIERLKLEKEELESRIRLLQAQLKPQGAAGEEQSASCSLSPLSCPPINGTALTGLSLEMIHRYGRHLLLPDFGVEAQLKLSRSSILVVGAGGLGSPVAMYLAACGVGCLGIVDSDIVELNNLHRQIIHTEAYIGQSKVKSAASTCHAINSSIKLVEHREALQVVNALDIVSKYDIVVDATDNLPSRYMISDCCVLLNKPLVSGAALGLEGQLTVYHHNGGPCYRCLFPNPPPAAACQRCSDSGVLGVVPGVIGCLQALEAIKVASDVGEPLSGRMLLFDALSSRIRTVKIRGRSPLCPICGENATFTREVFQSFDYENFTQSPMSDKSSNSLDLLPESSRISSKEYNKIVNNGEPHILVDVRPAHHFKIAAMPNSINIPLSILETNLSTIDSALKQADQDSGRCADLYVVCRRGNDSQRAVDFLSKNGFPMAKDIVGGLQSWARDVDHSFPTY